jgi:signal transduction histidine kinase
MRSLAFRLAALSALWLALGLGAAGWFVTERVTASLEAAFDARLGALLDAAVAGAGFGGDGAPAMPRPPALAELDRPFSGAYWQLIGPDGRIATSRSLWDERLPGATPAGEAVAFADVAGPRGSALRLAARRVVPAGQERPLIVAVALDRAPVDAEIADLRRIVATLFLALGAGLAATLVVQLLAGLAPLRRARRALARVREGRAERLGIAAPSEIAPLVAEIDALIAQNRATVDRARAHLGNLAHALKTPVAVLRNALEAERPDLAAARAEAGRLEHLVQHHLARARAAGAAGAAGAATAAGPVPLRPAAQEIAAALGRLFAGRGLAITVEGGDALRARIDRQDLAECLGNLMENACAHAHGRVAVRLARSGEGVVSVTVDDDGPGLSPEEAEAATRRGVRLDEATPGSGLGLAIVADLAALYGGGLVFGRSELGGLSARLSLPGG